MTKRVCGECDHPVAGAHFEGCPRDPFVKIEGVDGPRDLTTNGRNQIVCIDCQEPVSSLGYCRCDDSARTEIVDLLVEATRTRDRSHG